MKKLTKLLCAALVWALLLGAAVSCAKQPDSPVQDPPKQEEPQPAPELKIAVDSDPARSAVIHWFYSEEGQALFGDTDPNDVIFSVDPRDIAQELVNHARERKVDRRDMLLRDIRAYVVDNATDMNMGLTAVAREFRLKPRETAEAFRQYYGESINDVMHKTRVKKAKELLLTTNTPVQDIAEAVGYCSLATMYRAFTNVEGVAPGKLRQSKLHD